MLMLLLTPGVYLGIAPLSRPRAAEGAQLVRKLERAERTGTE